jgi:hypothetical protein
LQFHLNRPSRRARYALLHAHTGCLHPRSHPADVSAAWRPSPHTALEPQPHPGALAGAAAGPAGPALQTPYAAAAALSNAPRIGAGSSGLSLQARVAPAKRPRRMGLCSEVADGGENLEDQPRPREQIRLSQGPVSARKLLGKFAPSALNLFLTIQTKPCLGHCITRGIGLRRQATILRLRGAVLFSGAQAGPAGEFGRACGVGTHTAPGFLPRRSAANVSRWNMELCGSAAVIAEECGRFS